MRAFKKVLLFVAWASVLQLIIPFSPWTSAWASSNHLTDKQRQESLACSLYFAKKYSPYFREQEKSGKSDKFMHCGLSCLVAKRCGVGGTFAVGVMKEVWDFFGPGNCEAEDLKADARGIALGIRNVFESDQVCERECSIIYPDVSLRELEAF